MYMIYGNGGGIHKIISDLKNGTTIYSKRFDSIHDIFSYLVNESGQAFAIEDLNIKYYCHDRRIEKNVYMITINRYAGVDYIEEFGCPQFYKYMVDLNEEVFLL